MFLEEMGRLGYEATLTPVIDVGPCAIVFCEALIAQTLVQPQCSKVINLDRDHRAVHTFVGHDLFGYAYHLGPNASISERGLDPHSMQVTGDDRLFKLVTVNKKLDKRLTNDVVIKFCDEHQATAPAHLLIHLPIQPLEMPVLPIPFQGWEVCFPQVADNEFMLRLGTHRSVAADRQPPASYS